MASMMPQLPITTPKPVGRESEAHPAIRGPAGWTETTPASNAYRVTMTSGLAATGLDFGDDHVAKTGSSLSAILGGKLVWLFDELNGKLITPGSNSVSMNSIKFDPSQWQNSTTDTDDGGDDWIVDL